MINVKNSSDWDKTKDAILKHCIQEMEKKDQKNVVVLFDVLPNELFIDVEKDLKRLIKDKTIVEYPASNQDKQKGVANVKDFIEKENHVLFTKNRYFNGCEASNIIYLNWGGVGVRNSLLRAVKNIICVNVSNYTKIEMRCRILLLLFVSNRIFCHKMYA